MCIDSGLKKKHKHVPADSPRRRLLCSVVQVKSHRLKEELAMAAVQFWTSSPSTPHTAHSSPSEEWLIPATGLCG